MAASIKQTMGVRIFSGAPNSGTLDLKNMVPVGIFMPGAFTGTAVSIHASRTAAGTFVAVAGHAAIPFVANGYAALDYTKLIGVRYIRLVSTTNEGADRDFDLIVRPIGGI